MGAIKEAHALTETSLLCYKGLLVLSRWMLQIRLYTWRRHPLLQWLMLGRLYLTCCAIWSSV